MMRRFIDENLHHFNAGELQRCAASLDSFLKQGGKLMITLAGAMSTARIGILLGPAIRAGLVHAISCTGANLEEDLFRVVAPDSYPDIDWRNLSAEEEANLQNRVTDTCIPEEEAIRKVGAQLLKVWNESTLDKPPHKYLYEVLPESESSWLCAAREMNIPIFTPAWADSTLGNIFSAYLIDGSIESSSIIRNDLDRMKDLAEWYQNQNNAIGFLQVGGGIAGDYPICVVPMLRQDLGLAVPMWAWFAQISESRSSFGGYSGAPPNEKISWGKIGVDTPRFVIESDATIVLPMILQYLLDGQ
ncbi:MAG TPA: deoxyhypusine synthase [Candidatus Poseidoniales archaeon]|jgi:deoxyhypusine synthase|nr:MAG: deoxyhypusine synthase [Euryarchaeota archaeon]HIF16303.1 deoxyhypusine synthase [Candidatus Poseidoniales archaeon]